MTEAESRDDETPAAIVPPKRTRRPNAAAAPNDSDAPSALVAAVDAEPKRPMSVIFAVLFALYGALSNLMTPLARLVPDSPAPVVRSLQAAAANVPLHPAVQLLAALVVAAVTAWACREIWRGQARGRVGLFVAIGLTAGYAALSKPGTMPLGVVLGLSALNLSVYFALLVCRSANRWFAGLPPRDPNAPPKKPIGTADITAGILLGCGSILLSTAILFYSLASAIGTGEFDPQGVAVRLFALFAFAPLALGIVATSRPRRLLWSAIAIFAAGAHGLVAAAMFAGLTRGWFGNDTARHLPRNLDGIDPDLARAAVPSLALVAIGAALYAYTKPFSREI